MSTDAKWALGEGRRAKKARRVASSFQRSRVSDHFACHGFPQGIGGLRTRVARESRHDPSAAGGRVWNMIRRDARRRFPRGISGTRKKSGPPAA